MRVYKYIMGFLLVALLGACSDDIDIYGGGEEVPEGFMRINLTVPDEVIVRTRANDNGINSLLLAVYDQDGKVLQVSELNGSSIQSAEGDTYNSEVNTYTVDVLREAPLAAYKENITLYAIANYSGGDVKNYTDTKADLLKKTISEDINRNSLVMSGSYEGSNSKKIESVITMTRNMAKVSLETGEELTNFTLTGMQLVNVSKEGYLIINPEIGKHYTSSEQPFNTETHELVSAAENNMFIDYCYPSVSAPQGNDDTDYAFMLIKGTYEGTDCWYRVDFRKDEIQEGDIQKRTRIEELKPNHWYKGIITAVRGKGYNSPEEAMEHPDTDNIVITIEDNDASALSIVSDGYRKLGVSPEVVLSDSDADNEESNGNYVKYITVSLFSPDEKDYDSKITITGEESSWFSIDPSEDRTSGTSGKTYKFKVLFPEDAAGNIAREATVTVSWMGLQREVKIKRETTINPEDVIAETILIIHDTDMEKRIKKDEDIKSSLIIIDDDDLSTSNIPLGYWSLLSGEPIDLISFYQDLDNMGDRDVFQGYVEYYKQLVSLKGIDPLSNNGKIRNNGFHFPVMYGKDKTNPWWYEYQVNITNQNYTSIKVEVISDDRNLWNEDKLHFKVNSLGNLSSLSWNEERVIQNNPFYIKLRMKRCLISGDSEKGIPDDYQTGVATLRLTLGTSDNREKIYEFNLYHTGFFHVVEKNNIVNDTKDDITDQSIYDLWENKPSNFQTCFYYYEVNSEEGGYWLDRNICAESPYDAGGQFLLTSQEGKNLSNILCPPGYSIPTMDDWNYLSTKSARFDALCPDGYYAATKDNKESEYFLFSKQKGYIDFLNPDPSGGYSVRAFAKDGRTGTLASVNEITFSVKGADRVYLYAEENGERKALYPWPGKEINAMEEEKIFSFYTAYSSGELKVLFARVTENGKIILMSSNGATDLAKAEGWLVTPDGKYHFTGNGENYSLN